MQEIPKWIIKVIEVEKLSCRNCNEKFDSDNLMSIGVQESSKPPHADHLCIGLYCKQCKELIIFEIKEITLVDFAFEILDQETSNKIKKKSKNDVPAMLNKSDNKKTRERVPKRSKITRKEIDDMKNFLKPKDLLHEEFLMALGMLPDEIEKYNYKNRE